MIHAAILELPSGNIVKESEWYLHDSRRYLWPLSAGRFLLRRLNKLYEVDADFHERLILDSPQPLVWISVTPDGKQIITETSPEPAPAGDHTNSDQRVKISFMDAESLAVRRVIEARGVVRMEAASSGCRRRASRPPLASAFWAGVERSHQHCSSPDQSHARSPVYQRKYNSHCSLPYTRG